MARDKKIPPIRVTEEEEKQIEDNAAACSMGVTTYLRNLGVGYEVKSTLDQKLILDLLRVNADQGRLGGLLKLWLSGQEKGTHGMATDIRKLLHEIEETQKELIATIRVLRNDS